MKRPDESASALIDEKIKVLGDWRGKTLSKVREVIHAADPEAEKVSGTFSNEPKTVGHLFPLTPFSIPLASFGDCSPYPFRVRLTPEWVRLVRFRTRFLGARVVRCWRFCLVTSASPTI